ncbi:SMU1112c/YaeR family gloxylase I-like metalloprotein [Sediminibacillus massiliensis]|uniref:SMU1112c/YaeR family gloxylase I-like metalloprotein n=1 Tax=Sediminibacillus massiliensis TaxID=1926277 RepID=UPI000988643B|nr:VOC family protein [Sediminibacillus massiliensis]
MLFNRVHHIAVICSDYEKSKKFYVDILGFSIIQEVYREEKESFKLDLALNGEYLLELFSFPAAPERPSYPEARGLRHLAFEVNNIDEAKDYLQERGVNTEPVKQDPHTSKRFTFFPDPDGLPIELYEK